MTRVVSRALQPLCTSTALGKDWIPRLSISSFERIRDDMVRGAWVFMLRHARPAALALCSDVA